MREIIINGIKHKIKEKVEATGQLTLKSGNKRLTLRIYSSGTAETFIQRLKGNKVEGSTTALYEAAHNIMQETANSRNQEITYIFNTGNEHMFLWANSLDKGVRIFGWSQDQNYQKTAIIKPQIARRGRP